jgi:L-asparagine permease
VLASLVLIIPLLIIGWFSFRKRIQEAAAARAGFTGTSPVVAERPAADNPPAIFRKRDDEKK